MYLNEFIDKHFAGIKRRFAKAQGVTDSQVTQWIAKGFAVFDWVLYSPRRTVTAGGNYKRPRCLRDHIDVHHRGVQADFARTESATAERVHYWLERNAIVYRGHLYTSRRQLKPAQK